MKLRQTLNIVAVVVTLIVNGLANALPLNGRQTGQVSDSFPVLFTPAAYVFAIWGVIYLGLLAFAVYQALPAQRQDARLATISGWFVAGSLLNSAWIFLWHYGLFPLTLVAMLGLLISLLGIYQRLEIGRRPVSLGEKLFVNVPFSIYLGWISVATIANAAVVLYALGYRGAPLGQPAWTVAVLAVATALGIALTLRRREVAYPLVLVWAFLGIVSKQWDTPAVAVAAATAAALLVLVLAVTRLGMMGRLAGAGRQVATRS